MIMIKINDFVKKVEEGQVDFLVLNAKYDEKSTRNGVKEIVQLELEIQNSHQLNGRKKKISITLSIDNFEGTQFYRFVSAVAEGVGLTAFEPNDLIGLKGQASLSYLKPEGYTIAFPRLHDWLFYQRDEKVAEALAEYETEGSEEVEET